MTGVVTVVGSLVDPDPVVVPLSRHRGVCGRCGHTLAVPLTPAALLILEARNTVELRCVDCFQADNPPSPFDPHMTGGVWSWTPGI